MKMPNGYGSITKLKDKRRKPWRVMLPAKYEDGKEIRKILGSFRTKTEAVKALAVYNNDPTLCDEAPTFGFCYDLWYEKWKVDKSANSLRQERTTHNILKVLNSYTIDKLTVDVCQKFFDNLEMSPASKKGVYNVFNQIMNLAVFNDYCKKNYLKGVSLGKAETKIERVPLTLEEINLLWNLQGDYYVDVSLVQLYTGMRVSEVWELQKDNIHLNERYMIGGMKTKAGTNRVIPIHKKIHPIIERYYTLDTDTIFNGNYSDRSLSYMMKEMYKKYGMKHTSHDARVSFISRMSDVGVDLLTVKKIVGHANNDITTDLYTKKSITGLVEAIDKFDYA